jgi:hypothetical protein
MKTTVDVSKMLTDHEK